MQSYSTLIVGEPCVGARHVQQCIWTNKNKPNARVPVNAPHYQMLLTCKMQKWQDDNNFNPYLSTSQVSGCGCREQVSHCLSGVVGIAKFSVDDVASCIISHAYQPYLLHQGIA